MNRVCYKTLATAMVTGAIVMLFTLYSYAMYQYGAGGVYEPKLVNSENKSIIERIHALKLRNEGVIINLARCESTLNEFAVHYNVKDASYDLGVMQINKKWHPEVPVECSFNVECATRWADKRITDGYLHEWFCSHKI